MIRLESVEISRFRGIKKGIVEDFADVNVLIGRNNSGKSTVIEAIAWAICSICKAKDPLNRNALQTMMSWRQTGDMQPDLWYRLDQSQGVSVVATIGGERFARSVATRQGNVHVTDPPPKPNDSKYVFGKDITLFNPADARNREIEQALWPQLLANRSDKKLTQMLNQVFDLDAEGFQLLPDQRLLVMFPDYSVGVDLQGDGTRAALRSMMLMASLRSTLFIMEEPESHQHPGSLERFAATICSQARQQEVQLLISTHSSECLRSFLTAGDAAGSECAVFHLQREDGVLEANRLDSETVENLQSTGVDIRFLDLYA